MTSKSMIACGCGRTFLSKVALEQHHRDKTASAPASTAHNPCSNNEVSSVPKSVPMDSPKGPDIRNPKDRWLAKGAGNAIIDTLTSALLKPSDSEVSISGSDQYHLICSYNWVNKKRPTVYVPGGAPNFKAVSLPMTVKADSGRHFIDQNATKIPTYPFEVVFQAAELMNPTVRFDEIDVLTNRNSLRKFFDFCQGRVQDSFRVNLYLVNDTLIIERCVKSTIEFLYGSRDSGFGHNFEKAVTRLPRGLENSSGHHRVLQYNFGGLKCAVRFEVDASYDEPDTLGQSERQSPKAGSNDEEIESLATALSSVTVGKTGLGSTGGSADTICRGTGTEQVKVAELKSQKSHRSKPNPKWLPQLWFGRTQYLIVGHHENGTFDDVHVHDLREQMEVWEKNEVNQGTLQKMAMLLSRLRDIVRTTETKSCVLLSEKAVKPPVLRIHESMSGKGPLPASVVEKFWSKGEH